MITCDNNSFTLTAKLCGYAKIKFIFIRVNSPFFMVHLPYQYIDSETIEVTVPSCVKDGVHTVFIATTHDIYQHRVSIKRNKISTISSHTPTEGVWQGEKIVSCCQDNPATQPPTENLVATPIIYM